MSSPFPDIEIYLKQPELDQIRIWLTDKFDHVTITEKGPAADIRITHGAQRIRCSLFFNAVDGKFASLWFKSEETPWATDRDCALDAHQHLQCEIRCSDGSWQSDTAADDSGWLCFNHAGETSINWQT